jgi:RimJ/RimL family protein N-acetyltransferase
MNYSHLELARMQVEALFVHDANSKLLRINEPDPADPAPRFFMARTASGNIWRTRYDLPPELSMELERLAADEPVIRDLGQLRRPPYHLAEYKQLLEQHAPFSGIDEGPAYYLPELPPPTGTLTITPANVTLLEAHYPYTRSRYAELAPVVVRVVDGVAVAVCCSARITAQVAEAGVHTVEAYRGRGYAAEIVRGWAAGIRAMGRLPLYSTSWENAASQAIAAKLGAVLYGADFSIT